MSQAITVLIRCLAVLSAGKSRELRVALIDGVAPILCDLADEHMLIRWCTDAICEHKQNVRDRGLFQVTPTFTPCFTSTKVRMLTLTRLPRPFVLNWRRGFGVSLRNAQRNTREL